MGVSVTGYRLNVCSLYQKLLILVGYLEMLRGSGFLAHTVHIMVEFWTLLENSDAEWFGYRGSALD